MDDQVMGPCRCACDSCTAGLVNVQLGVFRIEHKLLYGHLCRMQNCPNSKVEGVHLFWCTNHK